MGIYFVLGQAELARALDIKGRNKAVLANILPLLSVIGWVVYGIITRDFRPLTIVIAVCSTIVFLLVGVQIQAVAVIQSVYRCKDGKNKKIYLKHKYYFDKKFRKHCQALHKTTHK